MKNILLLTDFSENALNAIHYAMHFFKSETCTFHIMNVHKAGSYTSADLMYSAKDNIYDSITKEPQEKLEILVEDLVQEFNNTKHTFKTIVDFDVFTDAVNQAVKSEGIDCIVIGTNGATGAEEVVFGSNTLNVIRKVDCSALVIPENYTFKPTEDILLALDPKNSLSGKAFAELLIFIESHKLRLHVLRIHPHHEISEKADMDILNLSETDCEYHKVDDIPMNYAVSTYLQTNAIDLVALFSRKEGFLERFFTGSTTTQLSKTVKTPLLILHP